METDSINDVLAVLLAAICLRTTLAEHPGYSYGKVRNHEGFLLDEQKDRSWTTKLETKYDSQFKVVFDAIRELMAAPAKNHRKIGFGSN